MVRQATLHIHPVSVWDFTFNGVVSPDSETVLPDVDDFVELIRPLFKKWCFQGERASRDHYQGRGSLFKKKRHDELCALLNSTQLRGMDVSESSRESQKGEAFYMLKYDTRVSGPWDDRSWSRDAPPAYIPIQYRGLMDRLYPFQETILNYVDDYRSCNIVVEFEGNAGKSTVSHLARLHRKGIRLPAIGDHKELIQVVCNILMGRQERHPGPIFVDLPRQAMRDPSRLAPFFIAIEEIKGGYVYDVRNHWKDWDFDSPPIWVFCNDVPDWSSLSMDRWRKWHINRARELVPGLPVRFA